MSDKGGLLAGYAAAQQTDRQPQLRLEACCRRGLAWLTPRSCGSLTLPHLFIHPGRADEGVSPRRWVALPLLRLAAVSRSPEPHRDITHTALYCTGVNIGPGTAETPFTHTHYLSPSVTLFPSHALSLLHTLSLPPLSLSFTLPPSLSLSLSQFNSIPISFIGMVL